LILLANYSMIFALYLQSVLTYLIVKFMREVPCMCETVRLRYST